MTVPPSAAAVAALAAVPDPVLRNLGITQCYHELSHSLGVRLGQGANWCSFATWASRQAGQSIRGQDLERALERELDGLLGGGSADAVVTAVQALGAERSVGEVRAAVRRLLGVERALARTSAAVARGNLKVFAEIGHEFARFLAGCGRDEVPLAASIDEFVAGLRPGDPPAGQQYLRQAFGHYYAALFEADPARRAQLLLLSNLEVGFHEQTRLQPEILEAVDAAVLEAKDLAPRLLKELLPRRSLLLRSRRFFVRLFGGRTPLDRALDSLVALARARVRAVISAHLMTLDVGPELHLRLGEDLRARFPSPLAELSEPELLALLARVDPTPDSTSQSGARDWADLPERMHYIADLFRCCHELPELLAAPFSAEQVSAIRAGRVPSGRL